MVIQIKALSLQNKRGIIPKTTGRFPATYLHIMATFLYYVIDDGTTAWVGDYDDAYNNDDEYGVEVIKGFYDINAAQKLADDLNREKYPDDPTFR